MSSIIYSPDYALVVSRVDKVRKRISESYRCRSLYQAEASLATSATTGDANILLSDPDERILARSDRAPHAMDILSLQLKNRRSQWGMAWVGFIDEVHRVIDPGQGKFVQINATSPMKKWEISSMSADDVLALTIAQTSGITGSAVLKYSAATQRANYPGPLADLPLALGLQAPPAPFGMTTRGGMALQIDPNTETGQKSWTDFDASVGIDPQQQTWSSMVQSIVGTTSVEWFFNEWGQGIWRRPGYLSPATPRSVPKEEIITLDLAESDRQVVTRVEVRWGMQPTHQTAAFWQAPAEMVQQLDARTVVVYASWITLPDAAQEYATTLGLMYAANSLIGTAVVPADPYYGVGTLIDLPTLVGDQRGVYYIATVRYMLNWGGPWLMTLGLRYGRSKKGKFPYHLKNVTYPSTGDPSSYATQDIIIQAVNDQLAYTLVDDPTLTNTVVTADPQVIPPGTVIQIRDRPPSARDKTPAGHFIGPSHNGEYTVKAGDPGQGLVIHIANTGGHTTGFITVMQDGPGLVSAEQGVISSPDAGSNTSLTAAGTGYPANSADVDTSIPTPLSGTSLAANAASLAFTAAGSQYLMGTQGDGSPPTWDSPGLVYWAYSQAGYKWSPLSAAGQYAFFQGHGAVHETLDQAVPGDLVFFGSGGGITHVGFLVDRNTLFSAMNPQDGIGSAPLAGFHDADSGGIMAVLAMSSVTKTSTAAPLGGSSDTFAYFPIAGGPRKSTTYPDGISQYFGKTGNSSEPVLCGTYFHTGLDFPCERDAHIIAPLSGIAHPADDLDSMGNLIGYGHYIRLDCGRYSFYFGHLNSWNVVDGQSVSAGDVIGYADSSGNSSGDHLHFGMMDTTRTSECSLGYIDPTDFLKNARY